MTSKKGDNALILRVPIFYNKRNGQRSIALPKKAYDKFMKDYPNIREVRISLWKPVK